LRFLETAGRLMSNGSANSVTEAAPVERRARMARRVGSARAAKVTLSLSIGMACSTNQLINTVVKYTRCDRLSRRSTFFYKVVDAQLTFVVDATGRQRVSCCTRTARMCPEIGSSD